MSSELYVPSDETIRLAMLRQDRHTVVSHQRGAIAAEREWGERKAHSKIEAPLHRVEMDSTQVDVFLVDEVTGRPMHVRPTLYVAICAHTRMVAGIHLDLGAPSRRCFLATLKNAIAPKSYVHQLFPTVQSDWPVCGYPYELAVDNGSENSSENVLLSLAALRMGIMFMPPFVPWYKGSIERFFRTLNNLLVHRLPGTTLGKRLPPRENNAKRDGKMTLKQLALGLHVAICDDYHHRIHSGISTTPIKRYTNAMAIHELYVPKVDLGFHLNFCQIDHRVLRNTGIHYLTDTYNSAALSEVRRHIGNGKQVEIRRDWMDRRHIYVIDPTTGDWLDVPCVVDEYQEPLPYASLLNSPTSDELEDVSEEDGSSATKRFLGKMHALPKQNHRQPPMSRAESRAVTGPLPAMQDHVDVPNFIANALPSPVDQSGLEAKLMRKLAMADTGTNGASNE